MTGLLCLYYVLAIHCSAHVHVMFNIIFPIKFIDCFVKVYSLVHSKYSDCSGP